METNQGLNGFFGWIRRHIHTIAGICAIVGLAPLGAALEALNATISDSSSGPSGGGDMGDNTMGKIGDYEPTSSEASILDPWVTNKLIPFYQNLLVQVKSAFANSNPDLQLQAINSALMKICVVRTYYATKDILGLSPSAINLRMQLIDNIFQPVEDMILNSITNDTVQLTSYAIDSFDTSQFSPLNIQSIPVNCEKYMSSNINSQSSSILTSSPVVVHPITNEVISNPNDSSANINQANKANSSTGIILFSILGLVILFYPSDKKKKK